MHKNPVLIVTRQILIYISTILRNILYLPYLCSLLLYISILIILIAGFFLSNDFGVNIVNSFIKILYKVNILNESIQNVNVVQSAETTKYQFLLIIAGFGIFYDLITRIILFFKKDFKHSIFQSKLLKIMKIFYISSFIVSTLIIIFIVKDLSWITMLFVILIFNIVYLALAYSVTKVFGSIIRKLDSFNLTQ